MTIPFDFKQIVSCEELLMSQMIKQDSLTRLLVQKGDIYEGRITGDGEGCGSGDEKEQIMTFFYEEIME